MASADSSITSYKVTIGVCVGVILLSALVLATAIWICGYSSWRSRGEIYTSIILYIRHDQYTDRYKHGVF